MSNVLTDWRLALVAQLDANLQGGLFKGQIVSGELDGVQRRHVACVYVPDMVTDGRDVNLSRPVMIVRAWLPDPKTPKRTAPPDPGPVEQLLVDLAACLKAVQVLPEIGPHGLWFFITELKPDRADFGVQATLRAWTENPFAEGG